MKVRHRRREGSPSLRRGHWEEPRCGLELARVLQPLRYSRAAGHRCHLPPGYGVEIGLLIDTFDRLGLGYRPGQRRSGAP